MASDDENFYTCDSGLDVEKEFDHDGMYDASHTSNGGNNLYQKILSLKSLKDGS